MVDLFEGQKAGKEGLADTHVRLVGRGWDSAFPTTSVFDNRNLPAWLFGEPALTARNNGCALWAKSGISPLDQKSTTGWLANLYGGVQSGWDDYARVEVPVNEMYLDDLKTVLWSYYMTEAEAMGVNMVIWVHDPSDMDKRAEITQLADIATLEKGAGWNAHELVSTVDQFYFYGENTTGTNLTEGPPNYYGLDDFVSDILFSTWTIYKISFEYGWQTGDNEFKDAWVADIKINGMVIPLKPDSGGSGRVGYRWATGAGALATALTPKTPFRLLSVMLHLNGAPTQETFTIKCDAGRGSAYDTLLYSQDLSVDTPTDVIRTFGEGYDFLPDDEIDCAWTNTDTKTYGITANYQTVY